MTVERGRRRACASLTVYDGSPAKQGGLKPGDLIIARQRQARSPGKSSDAGDGADQGPGRARRSR